MSRRLTLGVSLTLALTACQVAVTPPGGADRPDAGRATPRATARATATPAAGPGTPKPAGPAAATPVPVKLVSAPAGAGTLRGTVRLDAAYMVGAGAGSLIGNAGDPLTGLSGAAAVAAAGGAFVPAGGGNAMADLRPSADGSGLIGLDGGSLVGLDGGSLVGNAGNTLIGNAGNTLVGNAGNTFRLAQAPAVPIGTRLPASGMVVAAFSMTDGKPVPVGQGPGGEKVYGVYTDAAGGYTLHPPAGLAGNLTIVALPPRARDPRLTLGVFARADRAAPRDLDEAADTTADYVRICMTGQLEGLLDVDRETSIERMILTSGAALGLTQVDVTNAQKGIFRLEQLARRFKWAERSVAEKCRVRSLLAERVLSQVDLEGIKLIDGSGQAALSVLERRNGDVQEEVRGVMAAPPPGKDLSTVLSGASWGAGPCDPPGFKWELRRPADYMAFVVGVIMAPDPLDVAAISPAIDALRDGIGLGPQGPAGEETAAASLAVGLGIGRYLFYTVPATGQMPAIELIERELDALLAPPAAPPSGG